MKTPPEKLATALQRSLAPVYLLSGSEPLQAGEAADAIRAAARAKGFSEREVFFIDRANTGPWDEIFASAQAMSLFAARRILEIRIPGGKPGTQGAPALQELARLANADLLLLVIVGELDWTAQKSAWVQALDAAGVWVDAQPVSTAQFPAWLSARAAIVGLTLDADARQALAQQCEGNLLAATQELLKLQLAGYTTVGVAEVLASAAQSSRYDVTQLGEAVLRGDAPRALRVLAGLKAEGVEATLVLWSVWQELRALWQSLLPGPPVAGVWSRNKALLPAAAARLKPLGRAFFAHIDERMAAVDRIVKGRQWGSAWDELAVVVAEFAAGRIMLPLAARRA
ncbi:MAG TPA: DNA polymerase III subunit delta [Steroidobacteraceae bacterium]|nr:DNA polymerase III subunit delta [Steroidobacteraceae bacterium]